MQSPELQGASHAMENVPSPICWQVTGPVSQQLPKSVERDIHWLALREPLRLPLLLRDVVLLSTRDALRLALYDGGSMHPCSKSWYHTCVGKPSTTADVST